MGSFWSGLALASCARRSPKGAGEGAKEGPRPGGAYAARPPKSEGAGAAVGVGLAGALIRFIISKSFLAAGGRALKAVAPVEVRPHLAVAVPRR